VSTHNLLDGVIAEMRSASPTGGGA